MGVVEGAEYAIGVTPYGWLLVALALLAVGAQVATIVSARRRGRWVAWCPRVATAAVVLLMILGVLSVHAGRVMTMNALAGGGAPEAKAAALSRGIEAQLNGLPLVTLMLMIVLPLWLVALMIASDKRPASVASQSARAGLMVVWGLAVTAGGTCLWAATMIDGMAAMGAMPPDEKVRALATAIEDGRDIVADAALTARIVTAALVALAVGIALRRPRASLSAPAATPSASPNGKALLVSLAALLAAATLFVATRALRLENSLPWPPPAAGEVLRVAEPPTPDVTGPDPLERAPVVQIFLDRLLLDGNQRSPEDFEAKLAELPRLYRILHPEATFNGRAAVLADARLSRERLVSVLKILDRAGFTHPIFTFTRKEMVERPVLGSFERVVSSCVRATLISDASGKPDDSVVVVSAAAFDSYDALARRLVEIRRGGQTVAVDIED